MTYHSTQPEMSQRTFTSATASTSTPTPERPVYLTLLLSTGQRRRVVIPNDSYTINQVKQLVWESWPPTSSTAESDHSSTTTTVTPSSLSSSWPQRPTQTSSIRILHLGHILKEDSTLAQRGIPSSPPPSSTISSTNPRTTQFKSTVVHILVRSGQEGYTSADDDGK